MFKAMIFLAVLPVVSALAYGLTYLLPMVK
jgi:hypothetical protein